MSMQRAGDWSRFLGLVAFLVFVVAAFSRLHAASGLADENPAPDAALMALVVNTDYPQQERIDAMARVADQAGEGDLAARIDWFAAIAKNNAAPAVVRAHALDCLARLKANAPDLLAWMTATARDRQQPIDWRLSCLGRLDLFFPLGGDSERAAMNTALTTAVNGETGLPAATALLCLARLGMEDDAVRGAVLERVGAILANPVDTETALAAVQAAALLGDDSALSAVRTLARDASRELRLRLSATGALGEVGTADDLAVIESIRRESPLLRKVADRAAARLRERLGL